MFHFRFFILFLSIVAFGGMLLSSPFGQGTSSRFLADVGAVGIQVGVAPNPYNTLADQLHQKELALDTREAQLNSEQAALDTAAAARQNLDMKEFWGGGIILALILLNFALDFRRRSKLQAGQNPVSQ